MNLDFENLTDDDKSMIVVVGSVDRLLSNNVLRGEKTMLLTEKGRQIFERLEKEDYYVSPDKIMGLVSSRYEKKEPLGVERITMNGKDLIKKILNTDNFEGILGLEAEFKSKITLPVYELFLSDLKKSKINII